MGLGENQDLLPDPSLDGQIKLQNRLIRLYGIFQQCSQHSVHTGYSNRRWPWCVGSGKPSGRLRKRQPCDTFVSEKLTHKVEGQL